MTRKSLEARTRKALALVARRRGIEGWHAMRKDELVEALLGSSPVKPASKTPAKASPVKSSRVNPKGKSSASAEIVKPRKAKSTTRPAAKPGPRRADAIKPPTANAEPAKSSRKRFATSTARTSPPPQSTSAKSPYAGPRERALPRDLAALEPPDLRPSPLIDRLFVMVRSPYWLHTYWEISHGTIRRAEAALAPDWHRAQPFLRLFEISEGDGKNGAEKWLKDVEIHGGVNHWYIPVDGQHRTYKLQIGYGVPSGKFFVLAKSNLVTTPAPDALNSIDGNWSDVAEHYQEILALSGGNGAGTASPLQELFAARLKQSLERPLSMFSGLGESATRPNLKFQLEADLIIRGTLPPQAQLTLGGDRVQIREDGSFLLRMSLQEGRHMIPAVAVSADGTQQRTILLAIERNTKELEPQSVDESQD